MDAVFKYGLLTTVVIQPLVENIQVQYFCLRLENHVKMTTSVLFFINSVGLQNHPKYNCTWGDLCHKNKKDMRRKFCKTAIRAKCTSRVTLQYEQQPFCKSEFINGSIQEELYLASYCCQWKRFLMGYQWSNEYAKGVSITLLLSVSIL